MVEEAQAIRAPTAQAAAAAAQAAAERERLRDEQDRLRAVRAAADRDRRAWNGVQPTLRLRELDGNVLGVARSHRDLLDAFEALDHGTQRLAARWLARRAFEVTGVDRLDWVRPGLDALDQGAPFPAPFTEPAAIFPLVRPGTAAQAGRDAWPMWRDGREITHRHQPDLPILWLMARSPSRRVH